MTKESHVPIALHFYALFNDIEIPITIDTGSNICCITHTLIPNNQIKSQYFSNICGPDNKPLNILGTTNIILNIESIDFIIKVFVVKNLSCMIILGNEFLDKNKGIIDFDKQTMCLNEQIHLPIYLDNNLNLNQLNSNFTEKVMDLFTVYDYYSIAHCTSVDLKMNKGIALEICNKYGNMAPILYKLKPKIGDAIPVCTNGRIIYFLITKNYYFEKPEYMNIEKALNNLKIQMIKHHDNHIAMPKIASGLDKKEWTIIKQMIFSTFLNTSINVLICHKDNEYITNDWKTKEHFSVINTIQQFYNERNSNNTDNHTHNSDNVNSKVNNYNQNNNSNLNIFESYKKGENIYSENNCGFFAIINALNDGKTEKVTSVFEILELLELSDLPNYWFSDDELAAIANYYNHDTYIFNDTDKTGIIYGLGNRPPIVLYNVDKNTHWIPGTQSNKPSRDIPLKTINFTEFESLDNIRKSIFKHLCKSKSNNIDSNNLIIHKNNLSTNTQENSNTNNSLLNINTHKNNKETITDMEGNTINISPHLSDYQHKQAIDLISQYTHLFCNDNSLIKPANVTPCEIRMKPNYTDPKFNAPHRISPEQRVELKKHIDKLLEAGIIKPITSNFGAPAFLVNKKEKNSHRLVVSYKELNDRVQSDLYPIPRTTDLLRALENAQYFSLLDFNSAFFQIPVRLKDQYKLAFTSALGLHTFTRLPQGFKNKLLGHKISKNGIQPLDKNTKAITEFKTPKTQKDVRSFIGMCSYYRKHVKDFAKIADPLTNLIKGDIKKITWLPEHEESFNRLKQTLTTHPVLKHFDDDKKIFLTTDASITGLGACLEQEHNNILYPVGYASRKLLANEKTYSSTTLELLGLCFGDVTDFIKSCPNCQVNKKLSGKPIGCLQPIPVSNKPLSRLVFDYLGPLPSSNKKKYILVATCHSTKYVFTKAVESDTAESTVKFIIQIISQWGCFQQFTSDRGTHFRNDLVKQVNDTVHVRRLKPYFSRHYD
ncbi:uncharacterized protein LOC126902145 [Daktulosphaira vitifoliae]|uniref:uncharacterized protein LOC126902145 n=1 Tax=Daktulosphaira vitifoliae TaxID=58002 RepID=UPI0021A993DD|nr:uncharacterized protein LOC126902145 [Daktulosphaira vitifoliae]